LQEVISNFTSKVLNSTNDEATSALIKLFLDTKRMKLSEKDFQTQLAALGLTADKIELCWKFLDEESTINKFITSDELRFRDLEWRLEATVATRSLHNAPPEPKIVMKLHLDSEKSLDNRDKLNQATTKTVLMETDASSLLHIIDQLEQVLAESKSHRIRNFISASTNS